MTKVTITVNIRDGITFSKTVDNPVDAFNAVSAIISSPLNMLPEDERLKQKCEYMEHIVEIFNGKLIKTGYFLFEISRTEE